MVDLQHDWDTCLLNGFYKYPDHSTMFLFHCFVANHQLSHEQIAQLKRVPTGIEHNKVPILRFICAYLPKIADILWKRNAEDIEMLAKIMAKSSYDIEKVIADKEQHRKDVNEINRSRRMQRQNSLSIKAVSEYHEKFLSRGNASTTK